MSDSNKERLSCVKYLKYMPTPGIIASKKVKILLDNWVIILVVPTKNEIINKLKNKFLLYLNGKKYIKNNKNEEEWKRQAIDINNK